MSPSTRNISITKSNCKTPELTRLPSTISPKRYELKLDVKPEETSYTGQVNIRIFILEDDLQNTIWIHSKNLEIHSVAIQFSQFSMPIDALEIVNVPEKGCIGLVFGKDAQLKKGLRAWLIIKFSGKLSSNLEGFFVNPYR